MTESVIPGKRIREIRRKFVESLLSSMSKEELLDLQEHWQLDARGTLLEEFSRYVATVAPEQFRDTTRPIRKGDLVFVKKGCSCATCAPLTGTTCEVRSTMNEERILAPSPECGNPHRLVRLATPDGGYTGCCFSESDLELVGPDATSHVRVTTPRPPEKHWAAESPEEHEEVVRLNVLAKQRATESPAPRGQVSGRIMYDHVTKKFVVTSDLPGLGDHASRIADVEDYLKLLDERLERARLDRIEWLEGEVDRLWSRVWFLGAWAAIASAVVFGLLQFLASVYGS